MRSINWYPGHMNKARREIGQTMRKVDLVIEVLDARIPWSSENPLVAGLRGETPCLKLLHKRDLADQAVTGHWLTWLEAHRGIRALDLSRDEPARVREILALGRAMVGPRPPEKPIHAMILGIPNVGKSTLINLLAGRTVAKTANKPAVTRMQQRVRLAADLTLIDTPGFLWPKLSPPECGYRLAVTGAVRDAVVALDEVAFFAAAELRRRYPELLRARYGLAELPEETAELMEALAARRGCVGKRGMVNYHRISEILLGELRRGKLGRLSLETPADVPAQPDEEGASEASDTTP